MLGGLIAAAVLSLPVTMWAQDAAPAEGAAATEATTTETITTEQAAEHVGETKTVCGVVASARYLDNTNKRPTFLNFGAAFPNHTFTAVIMGVNRSKFTTPPEDQYMGKRICVTGLIRVSHGKPEVEVRDPSQIKIDDSQAAAPAAVDKAAEPVAEE